ncbi:MAG: carboxypeptidase regulatory-like domain-containing protein, partial [Gammaproteobacteria bacterium]
MRRAIALGILAAPFVGAQTFNARITGAITDTAQTAVAGAKITIRNIDTNIAKTAASANSGVYSIPLLLPGNYEVTVESPGLEKQVRTGVVLEANQTATLDFVMPVAKLSTSVEVTSEAPLLQSETSSVGTVLDARTIEDFPLVERDVMGALRAIPGVVSSNSVGAARGARNVFDSTFSVAGGRSSTNEVLIDGAANTIGDFNGVVILPPPDSVQELRVETSTYSAEFGRSGGGVVNIVTKSGTNAFHGNLYYYNQNTIFNANTFTGNRFNTPIGRLRRHQYGG